MVPGMEAMLALLRDVVPGPELCDEEWNRVLSLAEEHHLLPWVVDRLLRVPLSSALHHRLLAMQREAQIDSFYLSTELKRLMEAFESEQVFIVPLKGPFLGLRLLGEAALRVSYDLDMLVKVEDLRRAEEILLRTGFVAGTADDYHQQWHRGGTTLELHHDVDNPLTFDFCTADVLRRAERDVFDGQQCWRLAPEDELYYLCLHGVRHRFERLSLIFDLCLGFQKLTGPKIQVPAGRGERGALLCLGMAMARRVRPDPNASLSGIPAQVQSHMSELSERLWTEIVTGNHEPLNWQKLHAFYMELELPEGRMRRRWTRMVIALNRVIEPDLKFAEKFGLRRRWQAHLLRPVRLLRDKLFARSATGE